MDGDHLGGHVVAGGIGVEAAVDFRSMGDEWREPGRAGPGAGSGDAASVREKKGATEGVDGGLAENDGGLWIGSGDAEEAQIFAGARRHATPLARGRSAQFSAHRDIGISQKKEDGIGAGVGVKDAGFYQGKDERWRDPALHGEITFDALELMRVRRRKLQRWLWRRRSRGQGGSAGEVAGQPIEGLKEAQAF